MAAAASRKKYVCCLCDQFASKAFVPVLRHIGQVHQFEPNFTVTCGLNGCQLKYTMYTGYKTHLYRHHREFMFSRDESQKTPDPCMIGVEDENEFDVRDE